MDKIKNEVREDVERLLAMLTPSCDSDTFKFVREKLTRMIILSVPPASCQNNKGTVGRSAAPAGDDPCSQKKADDNHSFGEFSFKKESFIAP